MHMYNCLIMCIGMFVHFSSQFDWPLGPEIVYYTKDTLASTGLPVDKHGHVQCSRVWDTTAQFLFPWQPSNAYHALNDNSFYILTHIIWQYVTSFDGEFRSSRSFMNVTDDTVLQEAIRHILPYSRTLFMFNQVNIRVFMCLC